MLVEVSKYIFATPKGKRTYGSNVIPEFAIETAMLDIALYPTINL